MPKIVTVRIGELSIAITLMLGFAACGPSERTVSSDSEAHTYTVRGRVEAVPVPGNPGTSLMIHHESIPGFVDVTGKTVGMESMTMSFTPAKGLSLAAIKPGDKIEFVYSVDWGNSRSRITRITALPADTELDFGVAGTPAR